MTERCGGVPGMVLMVVPAVLTEAPVYAEENRILQRLKTTLDVDRLTAAALEKAAVVRHARITN